MGNEGEAIRYLPWVIHWKALTGDTRPALLPHGWRSALHQSELLGRVGRCWPWARMLQPTAWVWMLDLFLVSCATLGKSHYYISGPQSPPPRPIKKMGTTIRPHSGVAGEGNGFKRFGCSE